MASVLKLSLAFGLFGLVALAAILSWYFAFSAAPSADFYFEGTDETGNQIKVSAIGNKVDFEILSTDAVASTWKLYKTAQSYADTDAFFGFFNINSGDAAWACTKVASGASISSFSSLGSALNAQYGAEGGVSFFKLSDSNGVTQSLIPVAFSAAGVTNFGGYQQTAFSFGAQDLVSFKTGLPALPELSICVEPVADATESADAVVESATAPVCSSFPSLFAFLQKRSYATSAAATFCSTSSTRVVCTATTSRLVSQAGWFSTTDRAFTCTSATYGKIISFSGSDDILDWIANVAGVKLPKFGMLVHGGFWAKFTVWESYILANAGKTGKTTFNGHSLGGAIASIASIHWKRLYPAATVATVTCGAPAAFTSHSSTYTSIVHRRYVNFHEFSKWYNTLLPDQRDAVSVITTVMGFTWPSSAPQMGNSKNSDNVYSAKVLTYIAALVSDVGYTLSLHGSYPLAMDKARGTQGTY